MMKSVALMSASSPEPLIGIRVVSLASNLPGPIAAAQLASMGAQVNKIKPPAGDPLAAVARAWYDELVAAQEIVVLDLKQSEQRGRLDDYLSDADALITAMRPSALSRLDLHRLSETHPALVHVEIVGHDGDAAELPGHDLTYQAAHGTLCPPAMPLAPVADLLGAERAVSAAVSGLLSRTRVGRGGHYKIVLDHAARMAGAAVRHGLMGLQRLWGERYPPTAYIPLWMAMSLSVRSSPTSPPGFQSISVIRLKSSSPLLKHGRQATGKRSVASSIFLWPKSRPLPQE